MRISTPTASLAPAVRTTADRTAGPEQWARDTAPFASLVLHAKPGAPFTVGSGAAARTTDRIPYELRPVEGSAFEEASPSFMDAVAYAQEWSQETGTATGVFQASDGVYWLRPLAAWYPRAADGSHSYLGDVQRAGRDAVLDATRIPGAGRVDVRALHPDLKAVVDATAWVDARG